MNIWLCLGFFQNALSPLIRVLGAGPWLMALTLGAARLLASPACAREGVDLGRPIWKLGWLGWAY